MNKVFSLNTINSQEIEDYYNKALRELNDFFELNWIQNLPLLYILKGREAINKWQDEESTNMTGWTYGSHQFYIIDKDTYIKEKGENYKEGDYFMLIKHEMAHCFHQVITNGETNPKWLWEGIAVYISDQNNRLTKPEKFHRFLNSKDSHEEGIYEESGFAIDALINKYGKKKFLSMLSEISKGEFEEIFKNYYKNLPTYDFFNSLISNN